MNKEQLIDLLNKIKSFIYRKRNAANYLIAIDKAILALERLSRIEDEIRECENAESYHDLDERSDRQSYCYEGIKAIVYGENRKSIS